MAGLIGTGRAYKRQATQGLQQTAQLEERRNQTNEGIKSQEKQAQMGAVGAGAGIGMMAGMQAGSVGGPVGAGVGAAIGLLASEIF